MIKSRIQTIHKAINGHQDIIYVMTKTFRLRNNYALHEAFRRRTKLGGRLYLYIVSPQETSVRQIEFFKQLTADMPTLLKSYEVFANLISREELKDMSFDEVAEVIIDLAYLKEDLIINQRIISLAKERGFGLVQVDGNVVVPTHIASDKEEYSARTLRSKIWKHVADFEDEVLTEMPLSKGEVEALKMLDQFINERLMHYDQHNDPSKTLTSNLSPYLKYGMISPVTIYHKVKDHDSENKHDFIEELIVRRELAYNFVRYNPGYDDFQQITYDWAYETMNNHRDDPRTYLYTEKDYLDFNTHDPYFNAAMKEMVHLGRMHSYMRMYWCKKIIEWSSDYKVAYDTAMNLNNTFFLDGNSPNGYAGVAWCFGKHDRAWTERPIFGKLRYMNDNGLKRKFDIDQYVKQMSQYPKKG